MSEVPLSNMFGYATELRGITQGVGEFSMEYSTHKPVPPFEIDNIIQKFQKQTAEKASTSKKGSSFDL
jgi:elongation factor G